MRTSNLKTKHHIQRIVSVVVLCALFTWLITITESWFWIGVECLVYQFLCCIIIHIDTANEYKDQ